MIAESMLWFNICPQVQFLLFLCLYYIYLLNKYYITIHQGKGKHHLSCTKGKIKRQHHMNFSLPEKLQCPGPSCIFLLCQRLGVQGNCLNFVLVGVIKSFLCMYLYNVVMLTAVHYFPLKGFGCVISAALTDYNRYLSLRIYGISLLIFLL